MSRYCIDLKAVRKEHISLTGGKGANLGELIHAGFNVPNGFCISTKGYREFIESNNLQKEIEEVCGKIDCNNPPDLKDKSENIRYLFDNAHFSDPLENQIEEYYQKSIASAYAAVRSSAVDEDSRESSFAGQMDTFLFVKGKDELLRQIKRCWSSLWTPRALAYRKNRNISNSRTDAAVIIQEMIMPSVSGILFTADPQENDTNRIILEASWGLGEGIVSGRTTPDHFVIDKKGLTIVNRVISEKKTEVIHNEIGSGITEMEVERERQNMPSLKDKEIRSIADIGLGIERHFGHPQDIEWGYAKGRFYILQARPITTLYLLKRGAEEETIIWSNANIAENFPGVIAPFTFSIVDYFYIYYFKGLFEALGISERYFKEYESVFKNMVGLQSGRLYLNMNNWYEMLGSMPYYRYTKSFLDIFIGIETEIEYKPRLNKFSFFERGMKNLSPLIRFWVKVSSDYLFLDKKIRRFEEYFQEKERHWRTCDYTKRSLDELAEDMEDVMELFKNWRDAGLADTAALLFYGVLGELTKRWADDVDHTVHNSLLKALTGMKSAEPVKEMWRLSREVLNDNGLKELFIKADPSELYSLLKGMTTEAGKIFLSKVDDFLQRYGLRHAEELKISSPSLMEKPDFLFSIIKNYLASDKLNPLKAEEREKEDRLKITSEVMRNIPKGWVSRSFPVSRKTMFTWILKNAQRSILYRERVRFCQALAFGEMRKIALTLGENLFRKGEIENRDDVFFLTKEELYNYAKGKLIVLSTIKSVISLRKQEFELNVRVTVPDTIILKKGECFEGQKAASSWKDLSMESNGILRGIGSCNGKVTARARVILDPMNSSGLEPGDILVTRLTDPGWAPLFLTAGGLVLDRGGMLSHGSIIAREFGIPAVVGVKTGTRDIKDGQIITVDGDRGLVYLNPNPDNVDISQKFI